MEGREGQPSMASQERDRETSFTPAENESTKSFSADSQTGAVGAKGLTGIDDTQTNGGDDLGDTVMEEAESPFSSSSSTPSPASSSGSASQEAATITLGERMQELSDIELMISSLLKDSAEALCALNPAPFAQKSRKEAFATSTTKFLDTLEDVSARLKRNIRALEEEEIPVLPIHGRFVMRDEPDGSVYTDFNRLCQKISL